MIRIRRFVDWKTPEGALQLLGTFFFLLMVVMTGRPSFTNASKPPREIGSPLIALEQARNVEEIDAILGDSPSPDREVTRIKQYVEIPLAIAYGLIMLVTSTILMRKTRLAALIGLLGLAGSVVALLGRRAVLQMVETPLSATTQGMVDQLRLWNMGKWAVMVATMAVLSVFLILGKRWFSRLLGIANLAAAALLCAGIAQIPLLPAGAVTAGAVVALSAVTLKFVRYEEPSSRNSVSRSV